jgi:hypothetical protein
MKNDFDDLLAETDYGKCTLNTRIPVKMSKQIDTARMWLDMQARNMHPFTKQATVQMLLELGLQQLSTQVVSNAKEQDRFKKPQEMPSTQVARNEQTQSTQVARKEEPPQEKVFHLHPKPVQDPHKPLRRLDIESYREFANKSIIEPQKATAPKDNVILRGLGLG